MYVYTTPRFEEKVERYRLDASKLDELRARLERAEGIHTVRALFEPFPPYWKRRQGKLRFIAKIVHIGHNQVLCLLDVLERKDADYEQFKQNPRQFGKKRLAPLLSDDELQHWLQMQKKLEEKGQHQVQHPKPLPDELRQWLQPPGWGMDIEARDLVIYESEEWVRRFRKRDIQDYWKDYYTLVSNIVHETDSLQSLDNWPGLKLACHDNRCVLFSRIETADTLPRQVLFLLAPFDSQPSNAEIAHIAMVTDPLCDLLQKAIAGSSSRLKLEELASFASRTYPDYLLADDASWLAIEREAEANLALSPEEEDVLGSVSAPASGASALPIFINGRAGSGKSTMLFYLFADYCYRKWRQDLPGDPLFLTYNERLLEVAEDGVRKLLSSHHRFLEERTEKGEVPPPIDGFFHPFRKFLLDLLPAEQREHFKPEKYISFHRFKQLYMQNPLHRPEPTNRNERERLRQERRLVLRLPQARKWSPELCWHVIRTFIKGYRLDGYMDPDDYEEVSRKERTLSNDTFKEIHDTIWERWYKPITTEQGYWDDQDLIRKVLELECYRPEYTAVFCDEAQDFTRLELQLVMRLSVLSQYDLAYHSVHALPFAFAGDPFQTLNPTGFRWESLRAAFYDEIITGLDPTRQWNLDMNYQELSYNYRSTPPIVRATNLIQLWRHVLFDLPELQPQEWWQKGEFPEPLKFILDQNISPDELIRVGENTIIIIPCEEGQERPYIQDDPVLSLIFPQESTQESAQEPPKNVLSAITAKGLEFKRVILYKFGEACDETVWELLNQRKDHPVEFEYFFNKLYVAASRAMGHLFVVDSEEGDRHLWRFVSNPVELDPFLRKAENPMAWRERVQTIAIGTPGSIWEMREDDPTSVAQEFRTKGLSLGNPSLLRRAKQYYNTVGDTVEADLCEAWALKFEERFREAGELFLKHGKVNEAWECFWEGMCWEELAAWYDKYQ